MGILRDLLEYSLTEMLIFRKANKTKHRITCPFVVQWLTETSLSLSHTYQEIMISCSLQGFHCHYDRKGGLAV